MRSPSGSACSWWRAGCEDRDAARILMPTLFLMVIVLAIRALTLDGAGGAGVPVHAVVGGAEGLPDVAQALTQNAWDTGAGWG